MKVIDVLLKMSLDERLVINGESFYYFHTTPDELINDIELAKYLYMTVSTIRYSTVFNAITIEVE